MNLLTAFNKTANKILCVIMTVSFSVMVIITFAQVVFRYLLQQPLAWSEELARYLFIWSTFLGASVAFYEQKHINVSLFVEKIKSVRAQAIAKILAHSACLGLLYVYINYGFDLSNRVLSFGQVSPSMTWLMMVFVYLAIPVGSLFMALNVISHFLLDLRTLVSGKAPETAELN